MVTDLDRQHSDALRELAPLISNGPRRFLFIGTSDVAVPAGVQKLSTSILDFDYPQLSTLPLENIGAGVARRFMRGEWPIDPAGSYQQGRTTRAARASR